MAPSYVPDAGDVLWLQFDPQADRHPRLVWQQLWFQLIHAPPQLIHFPDALADHATELAK